MDTASYSIGQKKKESVGGARYFVALLPCQADVPPCIYGVCSAFFFFFFFFFVSASRCSLDVMVRLCKENKYLQGGPLYIHCKANTTCKFLFGGA